MAFVPILDPGAAPIAHRPVYRRIDPANPGRKAKISREEVYRMIDRGDRLPDLAIYAIEGDFLILKDGF